MWVLKNNLMKKIVGLLFISIIFITGFSSCKKLIKAAFGGTDVNVPAFQVSIPAIPIVLSNEISVGSYSFYFNLDSTVRANTAGVFGANDVNSIKVKQVNISITNADQLNNLANFDSARVTLQSNTNNNPAELLAIAFPDSTASTYNYFPTNSPELLPYLKGSNLSYTIYGKMRRITSKSLTMVLAVTLRAN